MNFHKITPCLWFNRNAEDAASFYISLFQNSKLGSVLHYEQSAAEASGQPPGSVMTTAFTLAGQDFLGLNGGPHFSFTPALSFFVACESEDEIQRLWAAFHSNGKALMALERYPFAEKYGWCQDRFGISWQLILSPRKQKISPALLFVNEKADQAQEALQFYTSALPESKIETIARDEKTGLILHSRFSLGGQDFVAMESSLKHDFDFTPATSFIIYCEDQKEIDRLWEKLSADPSAEQCGWLKDRFGISWQIVPSILPELLNSPEPGRSNRVMKAIIQMKKLDLQALKRAAH